MQLHRSFVRRNLAQSNMVAQRSITVGIQAQQGFLNRNFLFFLVPGWLAAKVWHFASSCSKIVRCNCQGRCRWRRPAWSEQEPSANPGAEVSLHSRPSLRRFHVRTWRAPADKKHGNELTPATETRDDVPLCAGVPQIQIPSVGSTAEFVRNTADSSQG